MAESATLSLPPYSNNSALYLVPVCTTGALALFLFILRIWTRLTRTGTLYFDDWLICVAEPLSFIGICLGGAAVAYGWGKPSGYITPKDMTTTLKLQFALQTVWVLTLGSVRLSVAASLLRFGHSRWWKGILYTIMGMQTLITSGYVVIQFAQCRPISAAWENVPDVECWEFQPIITYGWVIASIFVAFDLTLSLMPIKLIRTLTRPTSEKILIGVLMALGLLATAVAGIKMTTFNSYGSGDAMQDTIRPSMYAKLEEQVGIIAVCLPCLKSPAEQFLKRIGFLKEHQLSRPSFVNTMPLPDMPKDQDARSDSDNSGPGGKIGVRIDSVALKTGSSNSTWGGFSQTKKGPDSV